MTVDGRPWARNHRAHGGMISRSARVVRRLAVVSVAALVPVVVSTPEAWASPRPVSNLELTTQNGQVYVDWTPSPDTSSANVCEAPDAPPSAPTAAGATCSGVLTQTAWSFSGKAGLTYGVTVFSYDAAASAYGPAVSKTVVAQDSVPFPPKAIWSRSMSAQSMQVLWTDDQRNTDTKDFLLSWNPGLGTPAAEGAWVRRVSDAGVGDLVSGVVYTFAVRTRDFGGNVSAPILLRASTRTPCAWLADDAQPSGAHRVRCLVPGQYNGWFKQAAATLPSDGVVRVAAIAAWDAILVLQAGVHPYSILGKTPMSNLRLPLIASAGRSVVAAWTASSGVYYWTRGRASPASTVRGEQALGVVLDNAGRIHLLVARTAGAGRGLYYLTVSSGRTYRSFVAGSGPADIGLLARDPATDRIVVVDRHRGTRAETIRVKVLPAAATSVGTMPTWRSNTTPSIQWRPTAVAVNGGRISLGLQHVTTSGSTASDGPYVIYGTATMHRGAVRVAGTGPVDTNLTVSMPTARKAVFSWQRHDAGWSPAKLGIWVATRNYRPAGYWTFAGPTHWSTSAYDVPLGAFADAAGHTWVAYLTTRGDAVE